jgi:hypothetical protein
MNLLLGLVAGDGGLVNPPYIPPFIKGETEGFNLTSHFRNISLVFLTGGIYENKF